MSDVEFSGGVYKWTDKDGKKHVSDQAPPPGVLASDVAQSEADFKDNKCKGLVYTTQVEHKQVEDCLKKIRKAGKAPDYLEKLEKLKYVKDQKLDPYKSAKEYKRLDKILTTPSPPPVVLDTKGRIVPPKETTYSDSRLGQYLKTEDARAAKEGAKSQAEVISTARGVTKAAGVAVSRALGPVLDTVTAPLNPEIAQSVGTQVLRAKLNKLEQFGILPIDGSEFSEISNLIGTNPAQANQMLQEAQRKYIKGP